MKRKTPLRMLMILLLCLSFLGCSSRTETENIGTSQKMDGSETSLSESTDSENETPSGLKDSLDPEFLKNDPIDSLSISPYRLDRNHVDLTGYELETYILENGMINRSPQFAECKAEDLSEVKAEVGTVMLALQSIGPAFSSKTRVYSFRFEEIPPYDEREEEKMSFHGSRISFSLPDTAVALELLSSRNVANELDHAFVIQTIAQAEYLPYQGKKDGDAAVRLVIYICNDNGITDTFCIDENYYVLHMAGGCDKYWTIPRGSIADISTDPVPEFWYMKLVAMAIRYLHADMETTNDFFQICSLFLKPGATNLDQSLRDAFEQLELRVEYNGQSLIIENFEVFSKWIRFFYEDNPLTVGTTPALWEVADSTESKWRDAVKLTIREKEGENVVAARLPVECMVTPEGKLYVKTELFTTRTGHRGTVYYTGAKGNFVYSVQKLYPYEELKEEALSLLP